MDLGLDELAARGGVFDALLRCLMVVRYRVDGFGCLMGFERGKILAVSDSRARCLVPLGFVAWVGLTRLCAVV